MSIFVEDHKEIKILLNELLFLKLEIKYLLALIVAFSLSFQIILVLNIQPSSPS